MDPTQQDRLNRILSTQTAADSGEVIIPAPPTPGPLAPEQTTETVAAKKTGTTPVILIIAGIIFFLAYAAFWAYYFKLLKF